MFAGKTFLYIEDEEGIAEIILDELRELGAKCIHSKRVDDAIIKANFQKYDVIISDIRLLDGSGDDIIKSIKTNNKHVNYKTPIIVSSGYVSQELKVQIGKYISAFLSKPHKVSDLTDEIKKCLSQK